LLHCFIGTWKPIKPGTQNWKLHSYRYQTQVSNYTAYKSSSMFDPREGFFVLECSCRLYYFKNLEKGT
jgi:hypothetical protein